MMKNKFKIIIEKDLIHEHKNFRLRLNDKLLGLGSFDVMKNFSDEDLAVYFTEILNVALELICNNKSKEDE